MKKTIASLLASLFATAAFAQSPAPVTAPVTVKTEVTHEQQGAQADTKVSKAKVTTKTVKHVQHKPAHAKAVTVKKTKETTVVGAPVETAK
jgi:hypothetical protein